VTGAGEEVRALDRVSAWSYVIVPVAQRLSTSDVYAEADRLGLPRTLADLAERRKEVENGPTFHNDLEPATRSLHPSTDEALADARGAGASHALVCGSGPTVVGVFATLDDARLGAERLRERYPKAAAAAPAPPGFATPRSFA